MVHFYRLTLVSKPVIQELKVNITVQLKCQKSYGTSFKLLRVTANKMVHKKRSFLLNQFLWPFMRWIRIVASVCSSNKQNEVLQTTSRRNF